MRADEQKPDTRRQRRTSGRLIAKSISIKGAKRRSGGCAPKAIELTPGGLLREIRGTSADERCAARRSRAKPLVEALRTWLEKTLVQLAAGSSLAQAIRYGLSRWDGLVRFLDDGRIEIDSNTVERSMRPVALNRKNALFAGSDHGAENWAMLASLIETCKLHRVNPQAYLTDVLTKLVNNWPNRRLAELTPWAWTAATP